MKILFVCGANVGRSQMAEALFNKLSKKHEGLSAGTTVHEKEGEGLHEFVIESMKEEGIDASANKRKQLTKEMVEDADRVVVLCEGNNLPDYIKDSDKIIFWDIEDCKGRDVDFHKKIMKEIKKKIEELVEEIG